MQYKIFFYILLALTSFIILFCYSNKENKLQTNNLSEKADTSKQSDLRQNITSLEKKIKALESKNKFLEDQVLELKKQQILFRTSPIEVENEKYKLDENLKYKNEDKLLEKNIEELNSAKDKEDYKVNPSVDFNMENRSIDGVKIEVETKF